MLLTVKDACELHPMALDYSMSEQIENLSDVIGAAAKSAHDFFEKNYITRGMETLLSQGLQRLGGRSDQAVYELKQAMGGGKTHSMIALGLLARDSSLRAEVVPEIARAAAFGDARVVAVTVASASRKPSFGEKSPSNWENPASFQNSGAREPKHLPKPTGSRSSAKNPPSSS